MNKFLFLALAISLTLTLATDNKDRGQFGIYEGTRKPSNTDFLVVVQWAEGHNFWTMRGSYRVAISLGIGLIVVITTFAKFAMVKGACANGWKETPINIMIIWDESVHYACHTAQLFAILLMTMTDRSLSELFGESICLPMYVISSYGYGYTVFGSFMLAVYRACYLYADNWVKYKIGEVRLLLFLMALGNLTCFLLTLVYTFPQKRMATIMEYCLGWDPGYMGNLFDYNQAEQPQGPILVLAFVQVLNIGEALLYVSCFWRLFKQNRNISHLLSADVIKKRNRKHAQTLTAQMLTFAIEAKFFILIMLTETASSTFRGMVLIMKLLEYVIITISHVVTSQAAKEVMKNMLKR